MCRTCVTLLAIQPLGHVYMQDTTLLGRVCLSLIGRIVCESYNNIISCIFRAIRFRFCRTPRDIANLPFTEFQKMRRFSDCAT